MPKMVTLTIDEKQVTVPAGTVIVDAAKKAGIIIPVFCYHPKMEPVGMCRLCLVEIGRPAFDRTTGQPVLNDDGKPEIQFGAKLETGCTVPVTDGMVVRTQTQAVADSRQGMLEFLLTSHPLDCPICDKGGECPLQNLTMRYGPGKSRFIFDDKKHLGKHIPLGELIWLDRERCIQCGRCVRFQDQIADDPVIAFSNRGRSMEIITFSNPGFDSIFSGNTTDICPVGALTTEDFRFGARPWELNPSASICTHCPVGCNLSFSVRREAAAGGRMVIKRVLPRQNEAVNEIWICDKGRFGYHFTESKERLQHPLVRQDGQLVSTDWDQALDLVAAKLKENAAMVTLAGGRLSNEDLFNLGELTRARNGKTLLSADLAGGDLVASYGLAPGSNFADMVKGSAILVIASDLHEEAPVWWLRIKQAAGRGAALIVANPRATRLDKFAAYTLRYAYGEETAVLSAFLPGAEVSGDLKAAVDVFAAAENRVIIYGSEGLGLAASQAVVKTIAAVLAKYGKTGIPNNGLLAVWTRANAQGAWDNGFHSAADLAADLRSADVLLVAAADPAGDDPALAEAVSAAGFTVVQELFLTETARRADVVLPVQAFTEREGSLTSGERRVQRYYPALPPLGGTRPDFAIAAQIGQRLGLKLEDRSAGLVFLRMAAAIPIYKGLTYQRLNESPEQWPIMGTSDLYFGGTAYDNRQGLGVQLPLVENSAAAEPQAAPKMARLHEGEVLFVPVTRLYDHGTTLVPGEMLAQRLARPSAWLHPRTAAALKLTGASQAEIKTNSWSRTVDLILDESLPEGVALVPRSTGIPVFTPQPAALVQLTAVPEG